MSTAAQASGAAQASTAAQASGAAQASTAAQADGTAQLSSMLGGGLPRDRYQDLARSLTELTIALTEPDSVAGALNGVLRLALRAVPGCDAASVTVLGPDGRPATIAATDDLIRGLDQRQYELTDGPCLDAARRQVVNRWSHERLEERWPDFTVLAKEAGVHSYLSAGLGISQPPPADAAHADGKGEHRLGAINLASTEDHGFSRLDEELLGLLTGPASAAIVLVDRYCRARDLAAQLSEALHSRAEIDQAIGIVMAQSRCDADAAFAALARASNNRNMKLRELAAEIVARTGSQV